MASTAKCCNPSCENLGKHLCSNCAEASYCSSSCQKSHWSDHKLACKTAHKPEAAALLQSFKDLSISQLRNILKVKLRSFSETKRKNVTLLMESALEKPTLLKLVQEHVEPSEIDALLSTKPTSTSPVPSSSSGSSSVAAGKRPKGSKDNSSSKAPQMNPANMPSPDELRKRAREIRKNPDLLRRAQPAQFGKMSDAEIIAQVEAMEAVSLFNVP